MYIKPWGFLKIIPTPVCSHRTSIFSLVSQGGCKARVVQCFSNLSAFEGVEGGPTGGRPGNFSGRRWHTSQVSGVCAKLVSPWGGRHHSFIPPSDWTELTDPLPLWELQVPPLFSDIQLHPPPPPPPIIFQLHSPLWPMFFMLQTSFLKALVILTPVANASPTTIDSSKGRIFIG